jgi:formylglycine-generating enzyme required for sulfatase activity
LECGEHRRFAFGFRFSLECGGHRRFPCFSIGFNLILPTAWPPSGEQRGTANGKAKKRERQSGDARRTPQEKPRCVGKQGQTFVLVEGGEFVMGSPPPEEGREGGPEGTVERPHRRRIGRTFALAAHEVTVAQFLRFRKDCKYSKEYSPTPEHPINGVSRYQAAEYCNWLSAQEGIPEEEWCYAPNPNGDFAEGMRLRLGFPERGGYRLPTGAEWEYACRAEAVTSRPFGASRQPEIPGRHACYTRNSQDENMLPAGSLKPNDFGLFDMLGNAFEWVEDPMALYPAAGECY